MLPCSLKLSVLLFFTPHGTIYDQWKPGGADTEPTVGSMRDES